MVLSFSFLYSEITSRSVFRFPILSPSSLAISGILPTASSLPCLLYSLSLFIFPKISPSLSRFIILSHSFLFLSRSFYLPTFLPSLFSFYLLNLDFVSLFQINFLFISPSILFFSFSFSFTINLPLPFSLFYPLRLISSSSA